MITLILFLVGLLGTFGAVKSGCGRLAFMASMCTVLVIATGF